MSKWTLPIATENMRENMDHEPTRQYAEDIHKTVLLLKPDYKRALEVGSAWGVSTLSILTAGTGTLMSVDNNTLIKAPAEVEANMLKDRWAWNCCRSDAYWKENNNQFDLIYIDGSHLYVDVKNDLKEAWKRLQADGLLLIDDWDHKKNIHPEGNTTEYGVSLACFEFWRDNNESVTDVGIVGRVLWFRKRP